MEIRWLNEYKPVMAMTAVQCIYAAMAILAKATFEEGLDPMIFVVYRQAIATLVLVPISIFSGSSWGCIAQVSMRWAGYCLVFVASLAGVTLNQYFYYEGLRLANSSVATAMINLVPAITFVMATSIGMEKVKLKSLRSMAKVFGTIICVGGAISMGFFRGPKLLNMELPTPTSNLNSFGDQWIIGFLFLVGCACVWALWIILQVPICKNYLDPLSLSAWMSVFSTFQSAILAYFLIPDFKSWKITSLLELLSCLFVGIFGSGVTFYLQSWTISVRGPLFSSMFLPLCTVITTIVSVPLLNEVLYVGSLVGTVGVACGLYIVLWGKAKDFVSASKSEDNSAYIRDEERGHYRTALKKPLLSESSHESQM